MAISKAELEALKELTPEQRAELIGMLAKIGEMETSISTLTKSKADADQIIARAGEVETATKAKDAKIKELEGLVARYTEKKISYGLLSGFFGESWL